MSNAPKKTVIEDGTQVDGSIKSRCPIDVSGKLSGELRAPSLMVTSSGAVHGQVKVSKLTSQGELAGEIEADSVELSGRVNDQTVINAKTLEVKLNQPSGGLQVTFGNCELRVGERSAKGGKEQAEQREARKGEKKEPVL